MILPTPFVDPLAKPPDPPVEPPPPRPPDQTLIPGGLPSLLYVNPPPLNPLPDSRRGGIVVSKRGAGLQLTDIDFRPGSTVLSRTPGVEVIEWRGDPRKPALPPSEPPWQCPDCLLGHWDSAVIEQRQYTSTMLVTSFYDKQDVWHVHDPNLRTTWYVCTRGHRWTIQEFLVCPELTCIWPTVV